MSYDEVERGLPPVNEVIPRGTWQNPHHQRVNTIFPNWAYVTPTESNSSTLSASNSPKAQHRHLLNSGSSSSDGGFGQEPIRINTTSANNMSPPPPTQRFIIQDSGDDENEMKVIKLNPDEDLPSTLEPARKKPKLMMKGNKKPTGSMNIPKVRITASSTPENNPNTTAIARRAKYFILILLTVLPPLFFAIAIQFLKFNMINYPLSIRVLCLFQGIFCPAAIFLIFNRIWVKIKIREMIRKAWIQLLILGILTPCTFILQIISILYLDIIVSLSLTFVPIVIYGFMRNIAKERRLSIELFLDSILVYIGLILIGLSGVYVQLKDNQEQFLIGLAAGVGSILTGILCCYFLNYIRKSQIDDSISVTFFGLIGTLISLIMVGGNQGFNPENIEIDPGILSSVITFTFFGTIFQFIEAKLNQNLVDEDNEENVENERNINQRIGILRLSRTRIGVIILVGIWEIIKISFREDSTAEHPTIFNIFGVIFILSGYTLSVCYESWLISLKRSPLGIRKENPWNKFKFIPWMFSRQT